MNRNFLKVILAAALILLVASSFVVADEEEEHRPAKKGFFDLLLLPRYWMAAIFASLGLILLASGRLSWNLRGALLPIIFFVFAVIYALPWGTFAKYMGQHPSPVCTITKPILRIAAGKAIQTIFFVSLTAIGLLSIIGNKLFCGWVCPIGAYQELVHRIPLPTKAKVSIPFGIANTVRIAVFVIFVIVAFAAGKEIYEYFNPFEFLHWKFEAIGIAIFAGLTIAALLLWRPFCYFLCPMGLVTWLLEQISLVRIKVNHPQCDMCGKCTAKSPCPAVPSILEEKKLRPDCFACGRCIDLCPREGLSFRV